MHLILLWLMLDNVSLLLISLQITFYHHQTKGKKRLKALLQKIDIRNQDHPVVSLREELREVIYHLSSLHGVMIRIFYQHLMIVLCHRDQVSEIGILVLYLQQQETNRNHSILSFINLQWLKSKRNKDEVMRYRRRLMVPDYLIKWRKYSKQEPITKSADQLIQTNE